MPEVELRRESPHYQPNDCGLLTSLALRAEAVLGYSWLGRRLQIQPGPLAAVLNDLGIEPFRDDDVRRYKAEKERQLDDQLWTDFAAAVLCGTPLPDQRADGGHPRSDIKQRAARHGSLSVFLLGSDAQAKWRRIPLRDYDGPVPEFARSRALELETCLPDVMFEIEELRADKRYDPFLIAIYGNERFYIDVWEEWEFERKH
jgi:hypothetical protein